MKGVIVIGVWDRAGAGSVEIEVISFRGSVKSKKIRIYTEQYASVEKHSCCRTLGVEPRVPTVT